MWTKSMGSWVSSFIINLLTLCYVNLIQPCLLRLDKIFRKSFKVAYVALASSRLTWCRSLLVQKDNLLRGWLKKFSQPPFQLMTQWCFLHSRSYIQLCCKFFKSNTCNTFAIDSYHLEGVDVKPNSTVEHVSFSDGQINLRLNSGDEVSN